MTIKALFYVNNNGVESVWVTDGTEAGTELVPITGTPSLTPAIALGNEILFNESVSTGPLSFATGIGVTDGTPAGTSLIAPPANAIASYFGLILFDPTVIGNDVIAENDLLSGLLVTNGTASGTSSLSFPTVPAPFTWGILSPLYSLGPEVVFSADNTHTNDNGEVDDLWVSDGTSAGTHAIVAAGEAAAGMNPTHITVFGNKAIFVGNDSAGNDGLWVTDGTAAGTAEITPSNMDANVFPSALLTLGSKVLFNAYGTDNRNSLWVTDGTKAGTQELAITLPNSGGSFPNTSLFPDMIIAFGGKALFWGIDGESNPGLWVTDGTAAGTQELSVAGLNVGSGDSYFSNPTATNFFVYGNEVLFQGTDTLGKIGLWVTNGTSSGTYEITPSNVAFSGLDPTDFALAGSDVVFEGVDAAGHQGLWSTNGTAAGTFEITDSAASSTGSIAPSDLVSFGLPLPTTISGTLAGQAVTGQAAIDPFANVTIADGNSGQTETVTITLSAAGNGTLSNLGGGSYTASAGTYTVSGTAGVVTAAVDGLVFTPAAGLAAPGQTVTTGFTITDIDTLGQTATDSTTSVADTTVADATTVVNNSDDTSYLYTYYPSSTVLETIASYSGPDASGSVISDIVDNTDGTSLLYAYDPSSTVLQTASAYSATNSTNGAPAGAQISDVVDNADGTSLVYAYDPSSTVSETAQDWSSTNSANGAPAGSTVSEVVDNTDGTSLLYSYDPSASVTQTTSEYSATNASNGAPSGNQLSDVVDDTDGTAILYAYNPTATVSLTATYYSSYDASSGAPAGTVTRETFDYTNGESSITTFSGGSGTSVDYSGPDGTGSVIPGITSAEVLTVPDDTTISITGANQLTDPGAGSFSITFAAGASNDTLMLHAGGTDQITGFDPSAGDRLDLSALLSETQVSVADVTADLAHDLTVQAVDGNAAILFDPTGQGGGSPVAVLVDGASLVPQLQSLKAFEVSA